MVTKKRLKSKEERQDEVLERLANYSFERLQHMRVFYKIARLKQTVIYQHMTENKISFSQLIESAHTSKVTLFQLRHGVVSKVILEKLIIELMILIKELDIEASTKASRHIHNSKSCELALLNDLNTITYNLSCEQLQDYLESLTYLSKAIKSRSFYTDLNYLCLIDHHLLDTPYPLQEG